MDSVPPFDVEATADGEATELVVRERGGEPRRYRIAGGEQRRLCGPSSPRLRGSYGARSPTIIGRAAGGPCRGARGRPVIVDNL